MENIYITRLRVVLMALFLSGFLFSWSQDQLTNLSTFYITTDDGSPVWSTDVWSQGRLKIKSTNQQEEADLITEIRCRGNSTAGMEKKPYRLKLNIKYNLLGLPAKEKNWVLLANYADKTLIRNALAFKISELVGLEFSPSVRFVDVVMNGSFDGNYMVTDRMEVNKFRVPVEKQEITDIHQPEITGGYLLEIDGFANREPVHFSTSRGMPITIKYPKNDEINNVQQEYITNYVRNFEDILFSPDFNDKELGYRALVDTTSLINWYIACELTGNSDSFWSTYFYKKRSDNKLYFGPLWDFDIAFNNDNRLGDATNKLMRERAHSYRTWIERFWQDEWFRRAVNNRWKKLLEEDILAELNSYIIETANLIDQSQQKNFERWNILNRPVYLEMYLFDTYEEGVDFLSSYLVKRVVFLTESFADSEPAEPFVPNPGDQYMIVGKQSEKAITIVDRSQAEDALLCIWEPSGNDESQLWEFIPTGNGYFRIMNIHSELAITGGEKDNKLKQSTIDNTNSAQEWKIVAVDNEEVYGIINKKTGHSFDSSGGGTRDGNPVIEWNNQIGLDKPNQCWHLVKIKSGETNLHVEKSIDNVVLYPNPAHAFAYIKFTMESLDEVLVSLYDISGKQIYTIPQKSVAGENVIHLPVNTLSAGVYFVSIQTRSTSNLNNVYKLIIQ